MRICEKNNANEDKGTSWQTKDKVTFKWIVRHKKIDGSEKLNALAKDSSVLEHFIQDQQYTTGYSTL